MHEINNRMMHSLNARLTLINVLYRRLNSDLFFCMNFYLIHLFFFRCYCCFFQFLIMDSVVGNILCALHFSFESNIQLYECVK